MGDSVYRVMLGADKFSPDFLLDTLDISSEHDALAMADWVEAAMYVWQRKASGSHGKLPWSKVKELAADDDDKNVTLASRAESLLLCLKHRFPGLSQTTLDTSKIQFNKVKHRNQAAIITLASTQDRFGIFHLLFIHLPIQQAVHTLACTEIMLRI